MKKILAIVLMICMVLSLCSCGKSSVSVDISSLAGDLVSKVGFDYDLEEEAVEILNIYFELPEDTKIVGYTAQGETSESVFVAECASANDVDAVKATFQDYVDSQIVEMGKYAPEEVAKLEGAVLESEGVYVVLCVSADAETAKSVVGEYFGK